MKKVKIYDVPTRITHWFMVLLFLGAFIIAKTQDDESPIYAYHMIAGLTLGVVLLLRLVWSLFGSTHAQFKNFSLAPSELFNYFKNITQKAKVYVGHNPASSWAAIFMFLCTIGLITTGLLMVNKVNKETFEDIHELFANGFILLVIAHVLGLILHTLKHQDKLPLSMMTGDKNFEESQAASPISSTYRGVGIVFLLIILFTGYTLVKSYNTQTGVLQVAGVSLQLGESENETESRSENGLEKESDEEASKVMQNTNGSGESKKQDDDDEDDK